MTTIKFANYEWECLDFKMWSGPNGEGDPNSWFSPNRVIRQKKSVKLDMVPGFVGFDSIGNEIWKRKLEQSDVRPHIDRGSDSMLLKAVDCGGMRLTESLGYGLYRVRIGSELNPGWWSDGTTFCAWLDFGPDDKREIVFESGRKITDGARIQFVVFDDQSVSYEALRGIYHTEMHRMEIGFLWHPKGVHMDIDDYGSTLKGGCYLEKYEGNIEPDKEKFTINLRCRGYPDVTRKTSVTISDFQFHPEGSNEYLEAIRRFGR